MSRILWSLAAALLQAAVLAAAVADESPLPNPNYGVSKVWPLGGSGGWDYLALEPSGGRLFISRSDRVEVLETATGRRAGVVANTSGVHGIAFAPELKRGYTSNGKTNSVTAFDLASLQVILEAPIEGSKPDAILYEPQSRYVFTADGDSHDINVLDSMSLKVVASIALPGAPEFMATDAAGTVFVNIEAEAGRLVAIDVKTLKIKSNWALSGCANPTGLAIDAANHRLFSVCANEMMAVTDAASGKQVARVAIGAGPDAAAYDRDLGLVFSSNGIDGTLSVIRQETPDRYKLLAAVETQMSARTMALDLGSHKIYLAAGRLGDTPPPTAEHPHPRPSIVPDSFVILVAEPR
jgi:DNA-binding beta-propeller fold protein YncE